MTSSFDHIIIGGGHNGLTCAAYLAKAGRSVLVLEAGDSLGGAASTRPFADGFSSSCAHLLYLLDAGIEKDLDLAGCGLQYAARQIPTIALDENGNHLVIDGDKIDGPISADDLKAFSAFNAQMAKFAGVLSDLFQKRPPRLGTKDRSDTWTMLSAAMKVRMMGRADMQDFIRIVAINIYDVLNEYFENELLKGALSFDAVLGTHTGPRSPNSVFTYLYRLSANRASLSLPKGGMGAVTGALAQAAKDAGAEIRCGASVRHIVVDDGVVTGVELEDGETLVAGSVASSADPKRTMFDLLGAEHLETGFARRFHNIRMRGNVAKLDIALDRLPAFTGVDESRLGSRLLIAPTMQYVDRAFDHAKYGEFSAQPTMEITFPTVYDGSLAPDGKHVLSALVQYAPYDLKAGWDGHHNDFESLCIDLIESYAPDLRHCIADSRLQTPRDIERDYRMTGGHWHHGEAAIDQMLMLRPVPGAAQYASPVPGLILCGAGSHPGGGITGLPGRNAAREILRTAASQRATGSAA